MRSLQRIPVHYRAALTLAAPARHGVDGAGIDLDAVAETGTAAPPELRNCVTGDLHAQGALLHVTGGLPSLARVGSRGRVRIEIGAGDTVEFVVDVRHVSGQRIGVQFVG